MPKSDIQLQPFELERYSKLETNIQRLKAQLPADVVGTVVSEVLTRVTAYRSNTKDPINQPSRQKVEKLTYALISNDGSEGAAFIQGLQEDGARLDAIYLAYLAEAASILGEWWDEDHVSFHEVAIGTSRIYAILRELSYLFVPDHPVEVKSATFATVPGETHTLGVRMAADLLGTEGWNIDTVMGRLHEDLVDDISNSPNRIIGLSAGGAHAAGPLIRLVTALRLARPGLRIFLSGQIVNVAPDLVSMMDIDGAATDIDEAKQMLEDCWKDLASARNRA